MECNMKKLPDKAEIVEQIVTALGRPLRQHRSEAKAYAAVESAIETIEQLREATRDKPKPETGAELEYRNWYSRSGPHAASIRKAAMKFRKVLEPFSGGLSIELKDPLRFFRKGCDRCEMQLQVFRSALDWFGHTDDPPPSTKHLAAEFAHRLVNEFSQKPPTGTSSPNGQVREIAGLLYQSLVGGIWCDLKRQTDAVLKSARKYNCIIIGGGLEGNEPLQATIDGHTIFREPGEDELGFEHRAIEAARAARALPVVIRGSPDIEAL
jgi:hypothetical protein